MKIFNVQPIKVIEYIYNEEHLVKSNTDWNYESGFEFIGKKVQPLNTMFILFHILYCVGSTHEKEIITPTGPGKHTIEFSFIAGEDVFISYRSSCQFDFESEGFDADVASITDFLADYQAHTQSFFRQYGFNSIIKLEEESRMRHTLKADAIIAIDNLRENNMYEF
ncbi:hypothetical protein [Pedobacter caeni]|uniref:Uncharacterized protein n=1 Tax=Pedobacter caeni TaxID=288992 RepID=A0A1M4VE86_9SPHI|nr:hypothetical protein [Pedobacter caeni]SHE67140.1 hypothetical protein SAMN04488522_101876 [Pedobacter caeni]